MMLSISYLSLLPPSSARLLLLVALCFFNMSIPAFTSPTIGIVQDACQLVDELNAQYPSRRVELELFPTQFCLQLMQETSPSFGRSKAPTTMPRIVFDSLHEAATQCIGGDTSFSSLKFGGLSLSHFQLDPSYRFSLFQNGKIVVPHDSVFLVLHRLYAYATSLQDLKTLVSDVCAFVPLKVIKRFLGVMNQASSTTSAASEPALSIRMSTSGLNVTAAILSIQQMVSTTPPSGISHDFAGIEGQYPLSRPLDDGIAMLSAPDSIPSTSHVPTTPPSPVRLDLSVNKRTESTMEAPSTPRPSRKRPISAFSSPVRDSNKSSLAHSQSWLSLSKRLFGSETSSAHDTKKTRVLEDMSNIRQGEQDVDGSSKMAGKRRQRVHKKRNVPPTGRTADSFDDIPQTSPITKVIPGSFLLRGERLEDVA